jgi:acyl carrier protein
MNPSTQKQYPRVSETSAAEIQEWLVAYLSKELNIASDEIDVKAPFDRYGLSSMTAVLMTGEMEEWLGRTLDPTLPYDYPTVETLAQYLATPPQKRTIQ